MIQVKDIYGNLPTLETERLRLRKVTKKDVRDMFEYASNEKVSRYVNWEKHRKLQDTKEFVSFVLKQYSNQSISPWAMEIKALKNVLAPLTLSLGTLLIALRKLAMRFLKHIGIRDLLRKQLKK